jgi:hypothetical protein
MAQKKHKWYGYQQELQMVWVSVRTANGVSMPNCWELSLDAPPDQILTDSGLICTSGHRNLLFYLLLILHAGNIRIFPKKNGVGISKNS